MKKRNLFPLFFLCCVAAFSTNVNAADPWPLKIVTLVVPFAPGGGVDNVACAVAAQMSESLPFPMVVENRVGAGGLVGARSVAQSAPDGHTLLMGTQTTLAVAPLLSKAAAFNPINVFSGVGQLGYSPMVLVAHPSFPAKTISELISRAKSQPGQINYASGGIGTTPHMAGALLELSTGIQMTHVAYKGEQPALTDVMGNQVQLMFSNLPAAMPLVRGGKLQALAISSTQRSPTAPEIPTLMESGVFGFEAATWFAIVTPKDTPKSIVDKMNAELIKALDNLKLKQKLEMQGLSLQKSSPSQADKYIASEFDKWARVIKASNISTD